MADRLNRTTTGPVVGPEASADPARDEDPTSTGSPASGAPGADSGPVGEEDPVEDAGHDDGQDEEGDDVGDGVGDGQDDGDDREDRDERVSREAARRRRELRETRADRDRLAGIVERFQRRDVEAFVAEKLVDPADVWRDGLLVADVLDEEGTVDPAKLSAVVEAIVEDHPHWAPERPDFRRLGGGGRSNGPTPDNAGTRALGNAIADAAGRPRPRTA